MIILASLFIHTTSGIDVEMINHAMWLRLLANEKSSFCTHCTSVVTGIKEKSN